MKTRSLVSSLFICLTVILISSLMISCSSNAGTVPETNTNPTSAAPVTTSATSTTAPAIATPTGTTTPSNGMPTAGASPTLTPKYGGVLQILGGFSPSGGSTNFGYPPTALWFQAVASRPTVETLLREDSNLQIHPWLATSWEIANDQKSITFTLRQGVKFQDGTDFNAAAVKWNLDGLINAKSPDAALWTSVDVIDNYTVRINISHWANTILSSLANYPSGMMVSPTAVQKNGVDWAKTHPVGTGPFTFVSYTPNVSTVWKKFDGYWQTGLPYLDGIQYTNTADTNSQVLAFESGQGDMMGPDTAKTASDLEKWGAYIAYGGGDGILAENPDAATANDPLSNLQVREAIEYALDRDTMAKTLGYGIYTPAYQWARPGSIGYIPGLKREYDPTKAKQLLAEAGYPNGFTMDLNWRFQDWSAAIQGYLQAVGIKVNMINTNVSNIYTQDQTQGWHGLFESVDPAYQNMLTSVSQWFLTPGYYVGLQAPPNLQQLYNDAISTTTVEPAKVQAVMQAIWDNVSVIPVNYQGIIHVIRKNSSGQPEVQGAGFFTLSDIPFGWTPETTWLDK